MFTEQIKERDSFAGTPVFPASVNGANNTGTVDMSKFHRVFFLGSVGTLGGSATVDCKLQETNEVGGGNATDITNAAITQINTANSKFTLEIRADQVTKRYVRGVLTIGTAASVACLFPIGTVARYKPANGNDVDSANTQRVVAPTA